MTTMILPKKDVTMSEIRPSRRPGVVVYTRSMSLRLTADEVTLLDEVGVALGTSNSEVLRFLLRTHGPAYLSDSGSDAAAEPE